MVKFPWGHASDPTRVAPEPLEESLTPSRVILPNLRKRSRCLLWKASRMLRLVRFAQGSRRTPGGASAVYPRLSS